MKRKQALELIKLSTAEGDDRTAMRVYIENRISYQAYMAAMQSGIELKAKLNGRKLSEVTYSTL